MVLGCYSPHSELSSDGTWGDHRFDGQFFLKRSFDHPIPGKNPTIDGFPTTSFRRGGVFSLMELSGDKLRSCSNFSARLSFSDDLLERGFP